MQNKRELTAERLSQLTQDRTDREIGEMYGISSRAVQKRRSRLGIKPGSRRKFTPSFDELRELYETKSMREIAEHFGVGETVVWSRVHEFGLLDTTQKSVGHRRKPGSKHSPEHLEALREAGKKRRGKWTGRNSPNWIDGRSGSNGRAIAKHKAWKSAVVQRAHGCCERCGVQGNDKCKCCGQYVRIHAHHIKPYSEFPELRYDINNGQALCAACHYEEHFCNDS